MGNAHPTFVFFFVIWIMDLVVVYFDGYYAYIVDKKNKSMTPLVLIVPKENGELWDFTETHLI